MVSAFDVASVAWRARVSVWRRSGGSGGVHVVEGVSADRKQISLRSDVREGRQARHWAWWGACLRKCLLTSVRSGPERLDSDRVPLLDDRTEPFLIEREQFVNSLIKCNYQLRSNAVCYLGTIKFPKLALACERPTLRGELLSSSAILVYSPLCVSYSRRGTNSGNDL